MEDWIPYFGVQIRFEALTPIKKEFCEIPLKTPNIILRQKQVFEYNSALNYLTMTKLHMGWLDLNTKKLLSAILEFSILNGGKEGKCWISKNLDFWT